MRSQDGSMFLLTGQIWGMENTSRPKKVMMKSKNINSLMDCITLQVDGRLGEQHCLRNKPSAHPTTIPNRKGMEIKAWHVLLVLLDSVNTTLPQPPLLDLALWLMLWIMLKLSFAVLSTDLFYVLQRWGSAFEALWHIRDEWIQSKCGARMRISASLLFISLFSKFHSEKKICL